MSAKSVETEQDVISQTPVGVSLLLAQARQSAGLSQKEVADQLFLTTTFISYIDSGEFDKIPKPAFVRGYLRSYARVVGLDGGAIVEQYDNDLNSADDVVELRGVTEEEVGSSSLTGPVLQTGLAALVGLIIIIGLVWWIGSDDEESTTTISQSSASQSRSSTGTSGVSVGNKAAVELLMTDSLEQGEDASGGSSPRYDEGIDSANDLSSEYATPDTQIRGDSQLSDPASSDENTAPENTAPENTAPANRRGGAGSTNDTLIDNNSDSGEPERQATAALNQRVNDAAERSLSVLASSSDVATKPVSVERSLDEAGLLIELEAGGGDRLELSFNDECWVEISDGEGHAIYGDLNREGDRLLVAGVAPFEILLGRGSAVALSYNGDAVNVASFTRRDQTAKVVVGSNR